MPLQNVGPAGPTTVSPAPPCMQAKIIKVNTSAGDATGFLACKMPKGVVIAGAYVISAGANTTQTISVGITNGGGEFINAYAPNSTGYAAVGAAAGTYVGTQLAADTPVYAKASAALTSVCLVKIEYYMPQQGNTW